MNPRGGTCRTPVVLYDPPSMAWPWTNTMDRGEKRNIWTALVRALRGRCPRCGRAPLFRAYLKQVDACPECAEAWSEIRTDDAAPWLTILIVGHVMAPVLVAMSKSGLFSPWEMAAILVPVLIAMCLLILPRAKALFMAAIWALRAQSS
jgi:uncharacterized protein (DUF983 family)